MVIAGTGTGVRDPAGVRWHQFCAIENGSCELKSDIVCKKMY